MTAMAIEVRARTIFFEDLAQRSFQKIILIDQSGRRHKVRKIRKERASKPGSVPLSLTASGGRLSIWDTCCQMPLAVSRTRSGEKTNPCPSNLAPNRGLPSQYLTILLVRSYRTFAPLPPERAEGVRQRAEVFPFCLLPSASCLPKAVCFCGTILTIARTGRYPASLVFRESGLSSEK